MCQLFDERPLSALAVAATPNGKYQCYHCTPLKAETDTVKQALAAGPRPQAALGHVARTHDSSGDCTRCGFKEPDHHPKCIHYEYAKAHTPPAPPAVIPPQEDLPEAAATVLRENLWALITEEAPAVIREVPMERIGQSADEAMDEVTADYVIREDWWQKRFAWLEAETERLRADRDKLRGALKTTGGVIPLDIGAILLQRDTAESQLSALKSSLSGVIAEMEKTTGENPIGPLFGAGVVKATQHWLATLKRLQGAE